MLLDDLEGKMKRFQGDNNIRSIFSLDAATLDDGGEATFSAVIGIIATTSDGVFVRKTHYILTLDQSTA